jgi:hypothetical protein
MGTPGPSAPNTPFDEAYYRRVPARKNSAATWVDPERLRLLEVPYTLILLRARVSCERVIAEIS